MLKPDGQLHTKLSVLDCLLRQSTTAYYVTDKPGFVDVQCLCYAAYFWGKCAAFDCITVHLLVLPWLHYFVRA